MTDRLVADGHGVARARPATRLPGVLAPRASEPETAVPTSDAGARAVNRARSPEARRLLVPSLALATTLAAFLLRLLRVTYFNLSGDEAHSATFSTVPVASILDAMRHGEPHPPLLYLLYHVWIPVAGDSEYAMRFQAVVAGALTVPVIYVAGSWFLSRAAGLVAAALLAVNPYQLWNGQDARMYALASLLCLTALLATARALSVVRAPDPQGELRERSTAPASSPSGRRGGRVPLRWLALYGVCMTTALYTHYYSAYVIALLNAFAAAWILARRRAALGPWVGAQVAVTLAYAPWLIAAWQTITTYHGYGDSPSLPDAIRRALTTFAAGFVVQGGQAALIFWLFALLLAWGTFLALRRNGVATGLLLLGFLVPPAAIFVASLSRPVFTERYLMESSLPFLLLIAAVSLGLGRRQPRLVRAGSAALLVALALVSVWLLARYETATTTVAKARNASVLGAYLAAHAAPQDRVIFNILDPEFLYYYHRFGGKAPTIIAPSSSTETIPQLDTQLGEQLDGADRVWLMPDGLHWWDVHGIVPPWLDRHLQKVQDLEPTYQLVLYRTVRAARPVDVGFGQSVTLGGVSPAPGSAAPAGSAVPVTLLWRTSSPLHVDYTVSVQLLGPDGRLVAQSDGQPQGGAAPATSWRTTETVPDTRALVIPADAAPGTYTLGVALYDLATLQRLPVAGQADGLARVATLDVVRR